MAALQPHDGASLQTGVDPDAARAEQAEEREALEAIFDGDRLVQLGGGSLAVVTAFEPAGEAAPPLVVEVHMGEAAAAGYPLGGGLPLLAVLGGGLLEEELLELTAVLIDHVIANIDVGPLVFELVSLAETKAEEIVDARAGSSKKMVKGEGSRESSGSSSSQSVLTITGTSAATAHAAAAGPSPAAAASASAAPSRPPGMGMTDAQRRLAIAQGRAVPDAAKKAVAKVETFDDLIGGGGVDKGGYVKKKKK